MSAPWGSAIAYNVAVMIFGGFAPFIVAWLIDYLATPIAPAFCHRSSGRSSD